MSGAELVMGGFLAASDLVGRRVQVFHECSVRDALADKRPIRYAGIVRAVGSAPHGLVMWVEQEVEDNGWCVKGELFQAGGSDGILLLPVAS